MSTDLVRAPIAIPPALAKAGVTVVEQDGVRAVHIPQAMHETHNVVQPVTEIAQADPDWTPRLVEVYISPELDPPKGNQRESYGGRHVYVQDKMLALNKNAILLLAHAAGIDVTVQPMPRSVLAESEIGYHATATLRRGDGTVARWEGSRTVDKDDERDKVRATCIDKRTGQLDEPYFAKRWATEKDHIRAKCESKAMLRAVVAALQLKRGGYTPQELAKPFLIVGWSLTPSDPETKRELVRAAAGDAYGRRALPAPSVETSQYDDPTPQPQIAPPADVVDHVPPAAAAQEPEPEPEPVQGEIPPVVAKAGDVVYGDGFRAKGHKVSEVSRQYLTHIAKVYAPKPEFTEAHELAIAASRAWLAWVEKQEASA